MLRCTAYLHGLSRSEALLSSSAAASKALKMEIAQSCHALAGMRPPLLAACAAQPECASCVVQDLWKEALAAAAAGLEDPRDKPATPTVPREKPKCAAPCERQSDCTLQVIAGLSRASEESHELGRSLANNNFIFIFLRRHFGM